MKRQMISRRTVLRGLVGGSVVTLGLPPLDAMFNSNGDALADGAEIPSRYGVWFWGNGVDPSTFAPDGADGNGWKSTEPLSPLEPYRESVSYVAGTKKYAGNSGIAHHPGRAAVLSGGFLKPGGNFPYGMVAGPSSDVVALRSLGEVKSGINLGVSTREHKGRETKGSASWNAPGDSNPALRSPLEAFNTLFRAGDAPAMGGGMSGPAAAQVLEARKLLVDVIRQDAQTLRMKMGAEDQRRLDSHLEGMLVLETQLQDAPGAGGDCAGPADIRDIPDDAGHEDLEGKNALLSQILAKALACNMSRVFTYEFSPMQNDTIFWQVGVNTGMHETSHNNLGNISKISKFVMEQLAVLLGELSAIPEGDGTLLEHLAFYGTSECNSPKSHTYDDIPMIVCGRASGKLKGNSYVQAGGASVSKVPLTLMKACGFDVPSFGYDGDESKDTFGELEA